MKKKKGKRENGTGAVRSRVMKGSGKKILYARFPGTKNFRSTEYEDTPLNRKIVDDMLNKYVQTVGKVKTNLLQSNDIQSLFEKYKAEYVDVELEKDTARSYKLAFRKIVQNNFDINEKMIEGDKILYRVELEVKNFLNENQNEPATKNICLRSFQAFLSWAAREGYMASKIEIFKKYKRKAKAKEVMPYTEEELTAIFKKALFIKGIGLDFACWILFCRYTGSRIKESLELKWNDVVLKHNVIKFRNKINKDKIDYFPISFKLNRILQILKYLSEKRDFNNERLFRWKPNSKRFVFKKLTMIEEELGIKKEGRGAHGIRKLFSQALFDMDSDYIDKSKIAELMRHKSSITTDNHYRIWKAKQMEKTLLRANL